MKSFVRALWLLALASLTLASAPARGQLPPLFEFTGQYLPFSAIPDAGRLQAQVASYDAALNVPVPISESTFVIPGLAYHVEAMSYRQLSPGFLPIETLHAVDASLLIAHTLGERWSVSLRPTVGVAGNLATLDGGAWRWGLTAMGTYTFGRHLVIGAGALASYAFGEALPLPLVYLDWRPAPSVRLEASLPSFASLTLALGDRWELGTQADVAGNAYALRGRAVTAPCASGGACVDHLAYSAVTAGGSIRFRAFSSVWLSVGAGHTLWRRFEQKDASGRTVAGGPVDLSNEPMFRAGLVWRVPEQG
jgi:hypothetical protein